MKAGIIGVPVEKLLEAAKSVQGISVLQQRGFYTITGNVPGRAIYPQNNKVVNEIHVSGFSQDPKTKIAGLIANPHYPKPSKRVTHFVDQREGSTSLEKILEVFKATLTTMVSAEVTAPVEFVAPIAAEK